jgi:hypothetical protein
MHLPVLFFDVLLATRTDLTILAGVLPGEGLVNVAGANIGEILLDGLLAPGQPSFVRYLGRISTPSVIHGSRKGHRTRS